MKSKSNVIGAVLVVMLLSTIGVAQEMVPIKPEPTTPKPTTPKPTTPKPTTPKPTTPKPKSKPKQEQPTNPQPVPSLPDPKEHCTKAGGDWRQGNCHLERKWCEQAGNTWNESEERCEGRLVCPENMELQGKICVPSASTLAPVQEEAQEELEQEEPGAGVAGARDGAGPWRTVAFVGGGVLLGVGAVTGVMSLSKKSDWQDQCEGTTCFASAKDEYDTGKLLGHVSTGTVIGGAALMVVGFLLPSNSVKGMEQQGRPLVWVDAGPFGGSLVGRVIF